MLKYIKKKLPEGNMVLSKKNISEWHMINLYIYIYIYYMVQIEKRARTKLSTF